MTERIVTIDGEKYVATKLATPFADAEVLVKMADITVQRDITEWIYHKCGLLTEEDIYNVMAQFEEKKNKC